MRTIQFFFICAGICSGCSTKPKEADTPSSQVVAPTAEGIRVIGEQAEADTLKGSLKAMAMGTISNTGIIINYYSPAVRGRVIWGGVVPFENVWVTGAHKATSIEFNQEVKIGGVTVGPGKYALFTIPGKEEWTIIVNKNWDQHLTNDYDQKDDLVRLKVKPETGEPHQERLRYVIEPEGERAGEIVLYWETIEVSIPLTVLN